MIDVDGNKSFPALSWPVEEPVDIPLPENIPKVVSNTGFAVCKA